MMLESTLVNGSCFKCAIEIECVLYEMHMKRCVSVQEHGGGGGGGGVICILCIYCFTAGRSAVIAGL